ncbi:hypothetical protein ABTJ87_20000, partial [Acinetobacter baumannii]
MVDINLEIIGTREQLRLATAELIKSNYGAKQKAKQDSIRKVLEDQIQETTERLIASPLTSKQSLIAQRINTELQRDIAAG